MTSFFGAGIIPSSHESDINWLDNGKNIWNKYKTDNIEKLEKLRESLRTNKESISIKEFDNIIVSKDENNSLSSILFKHGSLKKLKLLLILVHLQVDKKINIDLLKIGDNVSVKKSKDGNFSLLIKRKNKVILNEKLIPSTLISSSTPTKSTTSKSFESYAKKYEADILELNKNPSTINPTISEHIVTTGDTLFNVLKDKFGITQYAEIFFILLCLKLQEVDINNLFIGDKVKIYKEGGKYKFSITQKGTTTIVDLFKTLPTTKPSAATPVPAAPIPAAPVPATPVPAAPIPVPPAPEAPKIPKPAPEAPPAPPAPVVPPAPVEISTLLSEEENTILSKLVIDKKTKTDVSSLVINIKDVKDNSDAIALLNKFTKLKTLKIKGLGNDGLTKAQATHMLYSIPVWVEDIELTDATYEASATGVTTNFKSIYFPQLLKKDRPNLKTLSFPNLAHFDTNSLEKLPHGITLNLPKLEKLVAIGGSNRYFEDKAAKVIKEKNIKLKLPASTNIAKDITSDKYYSLQSSANKEFSIFDKQFIDSIKPKDLNTRVLTINPLKESYIDELKKFPNLNKLLVDGAFGITKTLLLELPKFPKHIKTLEFSNVINIRSAFNGGFLSILPSKMTSSGINDSLQNILDKNLNFPEVTEIDDSLARDFYNAKTQVQFGSGLKIKQKDLKTDSVKYDYDTTLKRVVLKENSFDGTQFITKIRNKKDKMFNQLSVNEGTKEKKNLAFWSTNEAFPSLGIGHFIWGTDGVYDYVFPQFVDFLLEKSEETPPAFTFPTKYQTSLYNKLIVNGKLTYPKEAWKDKESFDKSTITSELRNFLDETEVKNMQREFIMQRAYKSIYSIIETEKDPTIKTKLKTRINKLINESDNSRFALLDYINFKGNGLKTTERVNGKGWGLKQVILGMNDPIDLNSFIISAKARLKVRLDDDKAKNKEKYYITKEGYNKLTRRINKYKKYIFS
jgi:hypothetical protein